MANVIKYTKNIAKSVIYSSVDRVKTTSPVITEFAEQNKEFASQLYAHIADIKGTYRKGKTMFLDSKFGEFATEYKKALLEDISSGEFYNKERMHRLDLKAAGSLADFSDIEGEDPFKDLEGLDFGSDDLGSDDDLLKEMTLGDMAIVDSVNKSSAENAKAVSTATVKSAGMIVETSVRNTKALLKSNQQSLQSTMIGFGALNSTLSNMVTFNNDVMKTHVQNATKFFEATGDSFKTMIEMDKERNRLLNELLELNKKNMGGIEGKKRESSIITFSDIVGAEGTPDLLQYFKKIKQNVKSNSGGLADALDMFEDGNILLSFASSPLKIVTDKIAEKLIPKFIDNTLNDFNDSLKGFFGSFVMKMNDWAEGSLTGEDSPIKTLIGKALGVESYAKLRVDPSKYNRGPMPWDGMAKKALVEVIPGYLARIESAITGSQAKMFDFNTGKWNDISQLLQSFEDSQKRSILNPSNDVMNELERMMRYGLPTKNMSIQKQKEFRESMEAFFSDQYLSGKLINFNDEKVLSRYFNDDVLERMFKAMMNKLPRKMLYEMNTATLEAIERDKKQKKQLEEGGAFDINTIFNNNYTQGMAFDKYHGAYRFKGNVKDPIFNGKLDKYGHDTFYYLQELTKEMRWQREHWQESGSGIIGGDSANILDHIANRNKLTAIDLGFSINELDKEGIFSEDLVKEREKLNQLFNANDIYTRLQQGSSNFNDIEIIDNDKFKTSQFVRNKLIRDEYIKRRARKWESKLSSTSSNINIITKNNFQERDFNKCVSAMKRAYQMYMQLLNTHQIAIDMTLKILTKNPTHIVKASSLYRAVTRELDPTSPRLPAPELLLNEHPISLNMWQMFENMGGKSSTIWKRVLAGDLSQITEGVSIYLYLKYLVKVVSTIKAKKDANIRYSEIQSRQRQYFDMARENFDRTQTEIDNIRNFNFNPSGGLHVGSGTTSSTRTVYQQNIPTASQRSFDNSYNSLPYIEQTEQMERWEDYKYEYENRFNYQDRQDKFIQDLKKKHHKVLDWDKLSDKEKDELDVIIGNALRVNRFKRRYKTQSEIQDDFMKQIATPSGIFQKLMSADSFSDKIKNIIIGVEDLSKRPVTFLANILQRADQRMFELLYGGNDEENRPKSFMGNLMYNMKNTFNDFSAWMKVNIFEPMADKAGLIFNPILQAMGIDTDNLKDFGKRMKETLFGYTDEDGNKHPGMFGWAKDYTKSALYDVYNPLKSNLEGKSNTTDYIFEKRYGDDEKLKALFDEFKSTVDIHRFKTSSEMFNAFDEFKERYRQKEHVKDSNKSRSKFYRGKRASYQKYIDDIHNITGGKNLDEYQGELEKSYDDIRLNYSEYIRAKREIDTNKNLSNRDKQDYLRVIDDYNKTLQEYNERKSIFDEHLSNNGGIEEVRSNYDKFNKWIDSNKFDNSTIEEEFNEWYNNNDHSKLDYNDYDIDHKFIKKNKDIINSWKGLDNKIVKLRTAKDFNKLKTEYDELYGSLPINRNAIVKKAKSLETWLDNKKTAYNDAINKLNDPYTSEDEAKVLRKTIKKYEKRKRAHEILLEMLKTYIRGDHDQTDDISKEHDSILSLYKNYKNADRFLDIYDKDYKSGYRKKYEKIANEYKEDVEDNKFSKDQFEEALDWLEDNQKIDKYWAGRYATGTKYVPKTGLAVLSEGEAVIPAHLNPFNKNRHRVPPIEIQDKKEKQTLREFKNKLKSEAFWNIPGFASGAQSYDPDGDNEPIQNDNTIDFDNYRNRRNRKRERRRRATGGQSRTGTDDGDAPPPDDDYIRIGEHWYHKDDLPFASKVGDEFVGLFNNIKDVFTQTGKDIRTYFTGTYNRDENSKLFKELVNDVKKRGFGDYLPVGLGGAILGSGVSMLTGFVGGPLIGAALGAGVALTKESQSLQNWLFGERDANGLRKGNLLSTELSRNIDKYFPDMAKGAVVGGITSILPFVPGGPVTGIILGSAIGFAKNNQNIMDQLFGVPDENGKRDDSGLIRQSTIRKLKKALPAMAAGGISGLVAGPFGIVGNVLVGSTIGFASQSEKFKEAIFGRVDQDGKRRGGLLPTIKAGFVDPLLEFGQQGIKDIRQWLKEDILNPLASSIRPAFKQISIIGGWMFEKAGNMLDNILERSVGIPLYKFFEEKIMKRLTGAATGIIKTFSKPIGNMVSLPARMVGNIGNRLKRYQVATGNADYMTARERLEFRKSEKHALGYKTNVPVLGYMANLLGHGKIRGDKTKKFDQLLATSSMDQLKQMQLALRHAGSSDRGIKEQQQNDVNELNSFVTYEYGLSYDEAKKLLNITKKDGVDKAVNWIEENLWFDGDYSKKRKFIREFIERASNMTASSFARASRTAFKTRLSDRLRKLGAGDINLNSKRSVMKYKALVDKEINSKTVEDRIEDANKQRHKDIMEQLVSGVDYLRQIADPEYREKVREAAHHHNASKASRNRNIFGMDLGPNGLYSDLTDEERQHLEDIGFTQSQLDELMLQSQGKVSLLKRFTGKANHIFHANPVTRAISWTGRKLAGKHLFGSNSKVKQNFWDSQSEYGAISVRKNFLTEKFEILLEQNPETCTFDGTDDDYNKLDLSDAPRILLDSLGNFIKKPKSDVKLFEKVKLSILTPILRRRAKEATLERKIKIKTAKRINKNHTINTLQSLSIQDAIDTMKTNRSFRSVRDKFIFKLFNAVLKKKPSFVFDATDDSYKVLEDALISENLINGAPYGSVIDGRIIRNEQVDRDIYKKAKALNERIYNRNFGHTKVDIKNTIYSKATKFIERHLNKSSATSTSARDRALMKAFELKLMDDPNYEFDGKDYRGLKIDKKIIPSNQLNEDGSFPRNPERDMEIFKKIKNKGIKKQKQKVSFKEKLLPKLNLKHSHIIRKRWISRRIAELLRDNPSLEFGEDFYKALEQGFIPEQFRSKLNDEYVERFPESDKILFNKIKKRIKMLSPKLVTLNNIKNKVLDKFKSKIKEPTNQTTSDSNNEQDSQLTMFGRFKYTINPRTGQREPDKSDAGTVKALERQEAFHSTIDGIKNSVLGTFSVIKLGFNRLFGIDEEQDGWKKKLLKTILGISGILTGLGLFARAYTKAEETIFPKIKQALAPIGDAISAAATKIGIDVDRSIAQLPTKIDQMKSAIVEALTVDLPNIFMTRVVPLWMEGLQFALYRIIPGITWAIQTAVPYLVTNLVPALYKSFKEFFVTGASKYIPFFSDFEPSVSATDYAYDGDMNKLKVIQDGTPLTEYNGVASSWLQNNGMYNFSQGAINTLDKAGNFVYDKAQSVGNVLHVGAQKVNNMTDAMFAQRDMQDMDAIMGGYGAQSPGSYQDMVDSLENIRNYDKEPLWKKISQPYLITKKSNDSSYISDAYLEQSRDAEEYDYNQDQDYDMYADGEVYDDNTTTTQSNLTPRTDTTNGGNISLEQRMKIFEERMGRNFTENEKKLILGSNGAHLNWLETGLTRKSERLAREDEEKRKEELSKSDKAAIKDEIEQTSNEARVVRNPYTNAISDSSYTMDEDIPDKKLKTITQTKETDDKYSDVEVVKGYNTNRMFSNLDKDDDTFYAFLENGGFEFLNQETALEENNEGYLQVVDMIMDEAIIATKDTQLAPFAGVIASNTIDVIIHNIGEPELIYQIDSKNRLVNGNYAIQDMGNDIIDYKDITLFEGYLVNNKKHNKEAYLVDASGNKIEQSRIIVFNKQLAIYQLKVDFNIPTIKYCPRLNEVKLISFAEFENLRKSGLKVAVDEEKGYVYYTRISFGGEKTITLPFGRLYYDPESGEVLPYITDACRKKYGPTGYNGPIPYEEYNPFVDTVQQEKNYQESQSWFDRLGRDGRPGNYVVKTILNGFRDKFTNSPSRYRQVMDNIVNKDIFKNGIKQSDLLKRVAKDVATGGDGDGLKSAAKSFLNHIDEIKPKGRFAKIARFATKTADTVGDFIEDKVFKNIHKTSLQYEWDAIHQYKRFGSAIGETAINYKNSLVNEAIDSSYKSKVINPMMDMFFTNTKGGLNARINSYNTMVDDLILKGEDFSKDAIRNAKNQARDAIFDGGKIFSLKGYATGLKDTLWHGSKFGNSVNEVKRLLNSSNFNSQSLDIMNSAEIEKLLKYTNASKEEIEKMINSKNMKELMVDAFNTHFRREGVFRASEGFRITENDVVEFFDNPKQKNILIRGIMSGISQIAKTVTFTMSYIKTMIGYIWSQLIRWVGRTLGQQPSRLAKVSEFLKKGKDGVIRFIANKNFLSVALTMLNYAAVVNRGATTCRLANKVYQKRIAQFAIFPILIELFQATILKHFGLLNLFVAPEHIFDLLMEIFKVTPLKSIYNEWLIANKESKKEFDEYNEKHKTNYQTLYEYNKATAGFFGLGYWIDNGIGAIGDLVTWGVDKFYNADDHAQLSKIEQEAKIYFQSIALNNTSDLALRTIGTHTEQLDPNYIYNAIVSQGTEVAESLLCVYNEEHSTQFKTIDEVIDHFYKAELETEQKVLKYIEDRYSQSIDVHSTVASALQDGSYNTTPGTYNYNMIPNNANIQESNTSTPTNTTNIPTSTAQVNPYSNLRQQIIPTINPNIPSIQPVKPTTPPAITVDPIDSTRDVVSTENVPVDESSSNSDSIFGNILDFVMPATVVSAATPPPVTTSPSSELENVYDNIPGSRNGDFVDTSGEDLAVDADGNSDPKALREKYTKQIEELKKTVSYEYPDDVKSKTDKFIYDIYQVQRYEALKSGLSEEEVNELYSYDVQKEFIKHSIGSEGPSSRSASEQVAAAAVRSGNERDLLTTGEILATGTAEEKRKIITDTVIRRGNKLAKYGIQSYASAKVKSKAKNLKKKAIESLADSARQKTKNSTLKQVKNAVTKGAKRKTIKTLKVGGRYAAAYLAGEQFGIGGGKAILAMGAIDGAYQLGRFGRKIAGLSGTATFHLVDKLKMGLDGLIKFISGISFEKIPLLKKAQPFLDMVKKAFIKVLGKCSGKITESFVGRLAKNITQKIAKLSAQIIPIWNVIEYTTYAVLGFNNAPTYFGVSKENCTFWMRCVGAVLKCIYESVLGFVPSIFFTIPELVNLLVDALEQMPQFQNAISKLRNAQEEANKKVMEYNLSNHTNYTLDQVNKRTGNLSWVYKGLDKTKEWGKDLKSFIFGNKVSDKEYEKILDSYRDQSDTAAEIRKLLESDGLEFLSDEDKANYVLEWNKYHPNKVSTFEELIEQYNAYEEEAKKLADKYKKENTKDSIFDAKDEKEIDKLSETIIDKEGKKGTKKKSKKSKTKSKKSKAKSKKSTTITKTEKGKSKDKKKLDTDHYDMTSSAIILRSKSAKDLENMPHGERTVLISLYNAEHGTSFDNLEDVLKDFNAAENVRNFTKQFKGIETDTKESQEVKDKLKIKSKANKSAQANILKSGLLLYDISKESLNKVQKEKKALKRALLNYPIFIGASLGLINKDGEPVSLTQFAKFNIKHFKQYDSIKMIGKVTKTSREFFENIEKESSNWFKKAGMEVNKFFTTVDPKLWASTLLGLVDLDGVSSLNEFSKKINKLIEEHKNQSSNTIQTPNQTDSSSSNNWISRTVNWFGNMFSHRSTGANSRLKNMNNDVKQIKNNSYNVSDIPLSNKKNKQNIYDKNQYKLSVGAGSGLVGGESQDYYKAKDLSKSDPKITADRIRGLLYSKYKSGYNYLLYENVDDLVNASNQYGIDPAFMVALGIQESGWREDQMSEIHKLSNNPFSVFGASKNAVINGIKNNDPKYKTYPYYYQTGGEAMYGQAKFLASDYIHNGQNTISSMTNPTTSHPYCAWDGGGQQWVDGISNIMKQLYENDIKPLSASEVPSNPRVLDSASVVNGSAILDQSNASSTLEPSSLIASLSESISKLFSGFMGFPQTVNATTNESMIDESLYDDNNIDSELESYEMNDDEIQDDGKSKNDPSKMKKLSSVKIIKASNSATAFNKPNKKEKNNSPIAGMYLRVSYENNKYYKLYSIPIYIQKSKCAIVESIQSLRTSIKDKIYKYYKKTVYESDNRISDELIKTRSEEVLKRLNNKIRIQLDALQRLYKIDNIVKFSKMYELLLKYKNGEIDDIKSLILSDFDKQKKFNTDLYSPKKSNLNYQINTKSPLEYNRSKSIELNKKYSNMSMDKLYMETVGNNKNHPANKAYAARLEMDKQTKKNTIKVYTDKMYNEILENYDPPYTNEQKKILKKMYSSSDIKYKFSHPVLYMHHITALKLAKDKAKEYYESKTQGNGSQVLSQVNSPYANMKFGDSTIREQGCGPMTAAMALNDLGINVSIPDITSMALPYKESGGTEISYFSDTFRKYGIDSSMTSNKSQILDSLKAGKQVVMLGQDMNNTSKTNSPFGPGSHYVLASGLDSSGNIIVKDPEQNRPMIYKKSILDNTNAGVTLSGGSSQLNDIDKSNSVYNSTSRRSMIGAGKNVSDVDFTQSTFGTKINWNDAVNVLKMTSDLMSKELGYNLNIDTSFIPGSNMSNSSLNNTSVYTIYSNSYDYLDSVINACVGNENIKYKYGATALYDNACKGKFDDLSKLNSLNSTLYIDCSAYISALFTIAAGKKFSRITSSSALSGGHSDYGDLYSKDQVQLQKYDILIYTGHVAMYVGDGRTTEIGVNGESPKFKKLRNNYKKIIRPTKALEAISERFNSNIGGSSNILNNKPKQSNISKYNINTNIGKSDMLNIKHSYVDVFNDKNLVQKKVQHTNIVENDSIDSNENVEYNINEYKQQNSNSIEKGIDKLVTLTAAMLATMKNISDNSNKVSEIIKLLTRILAKQPEKNVGKSTNISNQSNKQKSIDKHVSKALLNYASNDDNDLSDLLLELQSLVTQ